MQPPPYGSVPMYGGLRPLGVGEILDNTIQIYRKNFRALVTTVAVVVVPIQVVSVLITLSSRPSSRATTNTTIGGFTFSNSSTDTHDATVRLVGALVVVLLSLLAGWFAIGACTRGVADAYIGGVPADAGASLRVFARAIPSLAWLAVLALPPIIIGTALCFVPGVFLWVSWVVAIPALMIEGAKGTRALGRSFKLVRGRRWPILGLAILATLLAEVVRTSLVLVLVGVLLRSHSSQSTEYIVAAGVIAMLSSLLTTPLISTAYVILYFDLRVRSEGLDLQLVLDNLDSPATAPPPFTPQPPFAPPPPVWPSAPPPPAPPPPPPPPSLPPPPPPPSVPPPDDPQP
jgi:hypothetical protein